jgi:transcriptional regulator with XRE-family HTH domain
MAKKPQFRDRLAQVRAKRELTQAALAEKAGLTAAAISHFETGFRFPTAQTLTKLADALGVSVDFLLGRDSDQGAATRYEALFRNLEELSDDALEQIEDMAELLRSRARRKKDQRDE